MDVVNIFNPALPNQVLTSGLIHEGFVKQGLNVLSTPDRNARADITVVHGPNYALDAVRGRDNVLWLDRCWYGDTNLHASIGWLDGYGRRWPVKDYTTDRLDRQFVYVDKMRADTHILLLDDFAETLLRTKPWDVRGTFFYRHHPHQSGVYPGAIPRNEGTLRDALDGIGTVITAHGTSGVYAALKGCRVLCNEPTNPVYEIATHGEWQWTPPVGKRLQWAANLAWRQWSNREIAAGLFWNELCRDTIAL